MESLFQKRNTHINIIREIVKTHSYTLKQLSILLGLMMGLSLSNQSSLAQNLASTSLQVPPAAPQSIPQIKKEIYKNYTVQDGDQQLQLHSITEFNINGRIVQYTEFTPDSLEGEVLNALKIYKYDRQGNHIGMLVYNENNALVWSEEYLLNEQGRKRKVILTRYEEEAARQEYTDYNYNQRGDLVGMITYNHRDEVIGEYKKNYNPAGELQSVQSWSYVPAPEGSTQVKRSMKTDYEYHKLGGLNKAVTEIQEGKNRWKDIRLFENNYVIEWWKYQDGDLQSHYKHNKKSDSTNPDENIPPPIPYHNPKLEYDDSKRNPLENIPHRSARTITVKSNAFGNPVKEVLREDQQVVRVTYFYYNDQQRLSGKKKINKLKGWVDDVEYEYDQYQNLIRQTTYRDKQKISIQTYDYIYYN